MKKLKLLISDTIQLVLTIQAVAWRDMEGLFPNTDKPILVKTDNQPKTISKRTIK